MIITAVSSLTTENLDLKFTLFCGLFHQAGIVHDNRRTKFLITLTGATREYNFEKLSLNHLSLDKRANAVRDRFETPEHASTWLKKKLNFNEFMSMNIKKNKSECFL